VASFPPLPFPPLVLALVGGHSPTSPGGLHPQIDFLKQNLFSLFFFLCVSFYFIYLIDLRTLTAG
jgi:hypothetical protein